MMKLHHFKFQISTAWGFKFIVIFLSDRQLVVLYENRNQVVLDHMIPNAVVNQMGPTFSSTPRQNLAAMA